MTTTIHDTSAEIPLERLEDNITQLSGHIAAASARLLGWIADYDRREGWRTWGCKSAAHWLSWKCGDDLHTAREKVRTARALEALPVTSAAFAAGELSYSKVRAITRVALPDDETGWVIQAKHTTGAELERAITAVKAAIDRDENTDAAVAFDKRCVHRSKGEDGLDKLTAAGPTDQVEIIWAALDVIASQIVDDAADGTGRTRYEVQSERGGIGATRFDALVHLAEQVIAADTKAAQRGNVGRLALVIDTDGLEEIANANTDGCDDCTDTAAGEITLSGRRVAPEVAKRWACDIKASVVVEHSGHVHDEGNETKILNRRLRRALHRRDKGTCRFPGCGANNWLHAHHIIHWANGGPTDLDNLVSLCSFHHHMAHEGGWTPSLDPDTNQVTWTDPSGTPQPVEPTAGNVQQMLRHTPKRRITANTIQPDWTNEPLDFGFAIAVLTDHALANRNNPKRPRGDVFDQNPNPNLN